MDKGGIAICIKVNKEDQSGDEDDHGFQTQTLDTIERSLFFDQAIEPERDSEHNSNPGQRAVINREEYYADKSENNGNNFSSDKFFAEKYCTEENSEERVDKISQAGINRMGVINCPDIGEPVNAY